jgi:methionyl-tRNA formyltransferase
MELGSILVMDTIELIQKNEAQPKKQLKTKALKEAPKLTSENTQIDWSLPIDRVDSFIRGLSPFPSAWTLLINGGEEIKVKIFDCAVENADHTEAIGSLFRSKKELKVAVQGGYLYIKVMQLPAKRKMEIAALLNGYEFDTDAKFV